LARSARDAWHKQSTPDAKRESTERGVWPVTVREPAHPESTHHTDAKTSGEGGTQDKPERGVGKNAWQIYSDQSELAGCHENENYSKPLGAPPSITRAPTDGQARTRTQRDV
jgi:hypothetical protein